MDADRVYRETLVWDDHCGFEMLPDLPLEPMLRPWLDAGVGYLSVNVGFDVQPWTRTIENIAAIRRRLPMEADFCRLVGTVGEIDQARAEGKLAITFDIEGMTSLNGRIDLVQTYYDLGVRHMLFAYNRNNAAGSGCHDEDTGLTDFGRQVVDEMNRVGMVVDCSHTGIRTSLEAAERSAHPVLFSHSNPRALVDHERNITDEQIKACAAGGGVIGINGVNLFLGETAPTARTVARHAAYVAELTGPEHVGISLDFVPSLPGDEDNDEGIAQLIAQNSHFWPESAGYDGSISCLDICELPAVARELEAVGFSAAELSAVLGGNFRRVAEAVWK